MSYKIFLIHLTETINQQIIYNIPDITADQLNKLLGKRQVLLDAQKIFIHLDHLIPTLSRY